jgi:hypothetical protein
MTQFQSEFNAPPMAPPQYGGDIPATFLMAHGDRRALVVLACIGLLSKCVRRDCQFVMLTS